MLNRYSLPQMEQIWNEDTKYARWLEIELAVCRAWSREGRIPGDQVEKIAKNVRLDVKRIKELEKTTRHDMLAFIEGINETLGEESKYIHLGLTSSDVKDTALALQLKEAAGVIIEDLKKLARVLAEKARLDKETIMVGRTHGVHGEPVSWGLKLALWYAEIGRQLERMERVKETVSTGKLSGAVGTYSSIAPGVERLACRELGLTPAPVSNQIIQRDRQAEFLTTLALIAGSLEKFATEIRNLQRTEILEVEEGFRRGQKGSSAMPHKKNPIVCERITGLARVIRGNVIPGLENIALWHERDLTHSSVERIILPDSAVLTDYILQKFTMVMEELVVNRERMKANLDLTKGLLFSQRVMLALVDRGLSREEAYELAQRNALKSWQDEADYRELLRNDPGVTAHIRAEELERLFNYNTYLEEIEQIFQRLGLE